MSLEKIQSVVEVYIDSMKEASAEKVKEAFHPNGSVVGHLHGDFLEMSTDDFAGFVSSKSRLMLNLKFIRNSRNNSFCESKR